MGQALEATRVNPTAEFLASQRAATAAELIDAYARHLLLSAGAYRLPVQLDRVRARFSLPAIRASLEGQRAFTTDDLRIYLNADDRPTVQNFSCAHELMEMLFFALNDGAADGWMDDGVFTELQERKEAFCEGGAAQLLMPVALFAPLVAEQPLSFRWASQVRLAPAFR